MFFASSPGASVCCLSFLFCAGDTAGDHDTPEQKRPKTEPARRNARQFFLADGLAELYGSDRATRNDVSAFMVRYLSGELSCPSCQVPLGFLPWPLRVRACGGPKYPEPPFPMSARGFWVLAGLPKSERNKKDRVLDEPLQNLFKRKTMNHFNMNKFLSSLLYPIEE